MALLDHFSPPLEDQRYWHSFDNAWATTISTAINAKLPVGYFAAPNVQFGIEIDVATFENAGTTDAGLGLEQWDIPAPTMTIPLTMTTDLVEVEIFDTREGPNLVGAIELISPANKDRPASRDAFVVKCQALLQRGIGLAIVDIVTERRADLHAELLVHLDHTESVSKPSSLYASAYRPVKRNGAFFLDVWREDLAIGRKLPTLPLWLRDFICLRVDLEETYLRTCLDQRYESYLPK